MVTATEPAPFVVEGVAPLRLHLPPKWEFTDEAFHELFELNPEWCFEVDEQGRLVMTSPGGFQSGARVFMIVGQIYEWWRAAPDGIATGSRGFYRIGERAIRAPDVAWVSGDRLPQTREELERMLPLCPDFVIEVRSRSDRLSDQLTKMQFWIDHGARLGWLIDPFDDIAYIYRPGREPEQLKRPETLSGEDVLPGLVVDLGAIWWPAS